MILSHDAKHFAARIGEQTFSSAEIPLLASKAETLLALKLGMQQADITQCTRYTLWATLRDAYEQEVRLFPINDADIDLEEAKVLQLLGETYLSLGRLEEGVDACAQAGTFPSATLLAEAADRCLEHLSAYFEETHSDGVDTEAAGLTLRVKEHLSLEYTMKPICMAYAAVSRKDELIAIGDYYYERNAEDAAFTVYTLADARGRLMTLGEQCMQKSQESERLVDRYLKTAVDAYCAIDAKEKLMTCVPLLFSSDNYGLALKALKAVDKPEERVYWGDKLFHAGKIDWAAAYYRDTEATRKLRFCADHLMDVQDYKSAAGAYQNLGEKERQHDAVKGYLSQEKVHPSRAVDFGLSLDAESMIMIADHLHADTRILLHYPLKLYIAAKAKQKLQELSDVLISDSGIDFWSRFDALKIIGEKDLFAKMGEKCWKLEQAEICDEASGGLMASEVFMQRAKDYIKSAHTDQAKRAYRIAVSKHVTRCSAAILDGIQVCITSGEAKDAEELKRRREEYGRICEINRHMAIRGPMI